MTDYLVGIDVGGTFTDFVSYNSETRAVDVWKILSTPHDPNEGILGGLGRFDAPSDIRNIRLGTTVATNAILERKGAKVAFARAWVLAEVVKNPEFAEAVFDSITVRYPGTAHAVEAALILSRPIEGELPEERLIAEAERMLFETDQPDSARRIYEMVIERNPDGEYAAQALYALGWLDETHYNDPQKALERYLQIVDRFPRSDQAEALREKIRYMEESHRDSEPGN